MRYQLVFQVGGNFPPVSISTDEYLTTKLIIDELQYRHHRMSIHYKFDSNFTLQCRSTYVYREHKFKLLYFIFDTLLFVQKRVYMKPQ